VLSCMLLFEQHCSPVVTEFLDGICVPPPMRGVENLRRELEDGEVGPSLDRRAKWELLLPAERALRKKAAIQRRIAEDDGLDVPPKAASLRASLTTSSKGGDADKGYEEVPLGELDPEDEELTEEDVTALRRFYVARNRWHLALLLMQNPSLMKYRKWRLPKSLEANRTAEEEDDADKVDDLLNEGIGVIPDDFDPNDKSSSFKHEPKTSFNKLHAAYGSTEKSHLKDRSISDRLAAAQDDIESQPSSPSCLPVSQHDVGDAIQKRRALGQKKRKPSPVKLTGP